MSRQILLWLGLLAWLALSVMVATTSHLSSVVSWEGIPLAISFLSLFQILITAWWAKSRWMYGIGTMCVLIIYLWPVAKAFELPITSMLLAGTLVGWRKEQ
jgi:hypothetical protein